ncbi:MAG: ATP-binding protein [Actinomycetota bacterium]|nr:ATP-binding protein [Actinomycetota bacterium]
MIDQTRPDAYFEVPATHEALRAIGPWLDETLRIHVPGHVDELKGRLELAIHELCINVVEHAYDGRPGVIRFDVWFEPERITIRLVDDGEEFDGSGVRIPDPANPTVRGYGLMIVAQLVDDMRYERTAEHNVWSIATQYGTSRANP